MTKYCSYCERTAPEVVEAIQTLGAVIEPDEALCHYLVNGYRVLLCLECGNDKSKTTTNEELAQLYAPIDLPDGITEIEHTCSMLLYDGFPEEEATYTVKLFREGDYYVGGCTECGMQVRSKAVETAQ